MSIEEFFHDFRQELLAGAEINGRFQLDEFMEVVTSELIDGGFVDGFEPCHYYPAGRGMRVDGYWFNDEGVLDLFIADFDARDELQSLSRTEVNAIFKRLSNFVIASITKPLAEQLEVTSPEYGLSRQVYDRLDAIQKVTFTLVSDRVLSGQLKEIPDSDFEGVPISHQVWDISRLHRLRSSREQKEPLELDFEQMFGEGIACLPAHLATETYQSYLLVISGSTLATLYERFGSRLLEQNVRTFLQARGNVNKGIRATILNEPAMFFAYNNGVTATASHVAVRPSTEGLIMTKVVDLQIVNGGQTTASLFHTRKRDKADLSEVFVQMKLTVIDDEQSEIVVPRISQYANTQNRVNAADFFSNHPYHVRMEGFSRRIWAPAQKGAQRETKWFYERARGQYADAQSTLTPAGKKKFQAEHPKPQMFTKTDLAKFENVWDEHPRWVNLGAQKNFAQYAARIGKEWVKTPNKFNEFYFKRAVARAIIFRATERLVSRQAWYNGGYRANIVAYALATLAEISRRRKKSIDFLEIWKSQTIDSVLENAIATIARAVHDEIIAPPSGISNISEWCKREACWTRIQARIDEINEGLPYEFMDRLVSEQDQIEVEKEAKQVQKIDKGIEAQTRVLEITADQWSRLLDLMSQKGEITPKEAGVLRVAAQIPMKIPTERQSQVLLHIMEKSRLEGIIVEEL